MRYITNADNYLVTVSFGGNVECEHGVCTEYTGGVPAGYTSLEAWYAEEVEKFYRWKIVNGQLTMDAGAAAPPQCNNLVDMVYPVGSIYLTLNPISPANLFGGTWERIEDCFLLAAGQTYEAGTTGGEAEHTLTVEEMPSHSHATYRSRTGQSGSAIYVPSQSGTESGVETSATGGGKPHNNMPPYLAVYMWQRVADPEPDEPVSGLSVVDDGVGNVTIMAFGTASITDDNTGNVVIADSGSTSITDDGAGNVTIL